MWSVRFKPWFDGLTVTNTEDGETSLLGPVVDQTALHGLLAQVRDLNLPLVSVRHIELESQTGEQPCGTTQS
jgi:hypothetical protein